MPLATIYFDEKEDEIIRELSFKWNVSKQDVVKRLVKEAKRGDE